MAGEAVVGALRVILGMDTAQFEDGAKKAAKGLDGFGKRMSEIAGGIQLSKIIDRVTKAFIDLSFGVIDTADKIGKASEKFGIGVDKLSALKYAAEQADVPFESLAKGFKQLAKAATDVSDPTSAAGQAFKILGISMEDVRKNDPTELMLKIADGFQKFSNEGLGKASLSAAIFGQRIGPDLVPFLNQGREGIQGLLDRAKALGLVLSKETTDAAQTFNDRLKDVGAIAVGVATQFFANFLPAMAKIVDGFTKWAIESQVVRKSAEALSRIVLFLADNMNILIAVFKTWLALKIITFVAEVGLAIVTATKAVYGLVLGMAALNLTALKSIARILFIAGVFAFFASQSEALNTALEKIGDTVKAVVPEGAAENITGFFKAIGIDIKALTGDAAGLRKELEGIKEGASKPAAPIIDPKNARHLEQFNERLQSIKLQTLETAGAFRGALAPGFLQTAMGMEALKGQIAGLESGLIVLGPKARELNDAFFALRGAQITQEMLAPWDQLKIKLEEVENLYARGKLGIEAYNAATTKLTFEIAHAWGEVAQSIVSPMADAFKTLASMNKKYAGAAKALAIAEALVNTYLAATKALASGVPPFNYIAAAAVTAAGLANVAKISAQEFATGGSFKVGGGIGGIDSELITFKATPGEMVDIRKPGTTGSGLQEITLTGISGRDLFTGDMLRDLFASLNAGMADGYKLKVAT